MTERSPNMDARRSGGDGDTALKRKCIKSETRVSIAGGKSYLASACATVVKHKNLLCFLADHARRARAFQRHPRRLERSLAKIAVGTPIALGRSLRRWIPRARAEPATSTLDAPSRRSPPGVLGEGSGDTLFREPQRIRKPERAHPGGGSWKTVVDPVDRGRWVPDGWSSAPRVSFYREKF